MNASIGSIEPEIQLGGYYTHYTPLIPYRSIHAATKGLNTAEPPFKKWGFGAGKALEGEICLCLMDQT